jgi:hypothetical protein
MPGIRAGIGRFAGDVFAAIGSVTPGGRKAAAAALSGAPAGMVTPDALRLAMRPKYIKQGKKAVGYSIMGASALKMASTNRSSGAYNPGPRPITSAPPGVGRSA